MKGSWVEIFSVPSQAEEGSDSTALLSTWHLAGVNTPQLDTSEVDWSCAYNHLLIAGELVPLFVQNEIFITGCLPSLFTFPIFQVKWLSSSQE